METDSRRKGWYPRSSIALSAAVVIVATLTFAGSPADARATASPIRHVVIIDEENHSFDNLLGKFCYQVGVGAIERPGYDARCAGTRYGLLPDGTKFLLPATPDVGLSILHSIAAQLTEIDGGRMDGWARVSRCGAQTKLRHACMTAFGAMS